MTLHDLFTNDPTGLAKVTPSSITRLHHGDRFHLPMPQVRKTLTGADLRMLACNGSIPGPTLHVDQGSEITVHVINEGEVDTTVHWHGLRLENRFDGVPHETQQPIPVGGTFTYKVQFPDAGLYWYHPHIREDFAQEMGLYGTILVEDGHIAPFRKSGPTFNAMGRFGNVMLINGETEFAAEVAQGEVVRLYLVNTAHTRIFNVAVSGARTKLVGGDSGRYEQETFVDEVLLGPSERAVLDVLFDTPGTSQLEHRTPDRTYDLGRFHVAGKGASQAVPSFGILRTAPDLTAERQRIEHDIERAPDKVLGFTSLMPLLYGQGATQAELYACPMHPEVTAAEPTTCPKCGMKLVPSDSVATSVSAPHNSTHGADDPGDGLEWEDLMPDINRASDPSNMIWKLIDRQTGAENGAISWAFAVGDRVKIRLVNEMESDHPMHHPFHIHAAGRSLILARDSQREANLARKDTGLVRAGQTVDILLDVTNPGLWMAHCHIAEHAESGMMFSFKVHPSPPRTL